MKIIFETPNLIVREYVDSDFKPLHKIFSNPRTMKFWPEPFTQEQTKNWIKRAFESYKENGFGRWIVILRETGEIIGDCGFFKTEIDGNPENDIGYIIDFNYWKKGFGTELAKACKNYGVDRLGFKRICANMAHDHIGSQKVAEKIGMKKEKEFYNIKNRNILTYLYYIES